MSLAPNIHRNPTQDLYRDLDGNFRTVFIVNSQPADTGSLHDFMRSFNATHNNEDICFFGQEDDRVTRMEIMVGYSSEFERQFREEFKPHYN